VRYAAAAILVSSITIVAASPAAVLAICATVSAQAASQSGSELTFDVVSIKARTADETTPFRVSF